MKNNVLSLYKFDPKTIEIGTDTIPQIDFLNDKIMGEENNKIIHSNVKLKQEDDFKINQDTVEAFEKRKRELGQSKIKFISIQSFTK